MLKKRLVRNSFKFLTKHGFLYSYKHDSYNFFSLMYQKGNVILMPSFDYIDKRFGVYVKGVKNCMPDMYVNIIDIEIDTSDNRMALKQALSQIILDSKKHTHGMPHRYFKAIVELYAEFVEKNINDVLERTN